MLENFPAYIKSIAAKDQQTLLEEPSQRELYKRKGRSPFSASMIRYALHLWYTSLQVYKLVIKKSRKPSVLFLNKIQPGGKDSLKMLGKRNEISLDLVLMVYEM